MAAGALILEKHFTHDPAASGPDHATSIDPDGFARYVEFAHRGHSAVGSRCEKTPQVFESDVRKIARQSLRASRPLAAGTRLTQDDLVAMRPGDGLEPWCREELIGRILKRTLEVEELIVMDDLE